MAQADAILDALDEHQQRAARVVDGPVLILAGAGSGKTRTITHRIAYACATGAQQERNALAVTFTAKAAGQMRARLSALGVSDVAVSTFHAAALRQLKYFWPKAVGGPPPALVTAKAPLIAEAAAAVGLPHDRLLVRDLAAELEWAKVSRLPKEGYVGAASRAQRPAPAGTTLEEVAAAYGVYSDLLAGRGLMDFEDVLLLTAALLEERADLAEQVRARYRWITVDEYQDVSAAQHALLKVWLGDSDDVCVVGDPGQTIYTFAGASAHYLQSFPQWFPQAAVVPLARTYRCSPQIVSAANSLLGARRARSTLPPLRLASARAEGPPVKVRAFADDIAEAEGVAEAVRAWRGAGVPLREIAILVRSNAATAPIEDALADAGIGYVLTGGERFFARPEIKEAMLRLRGAANAGSGGPGLTAEVAQVLAAMGFHQDMAPTGRGAIRERWESLAALAGLAQEMAQQSPDAVVADLVAELQRRAALEAEPVADGVQLATLHAAKGLEWDCVWIAGVQEGSLPISYADTPERIEEERRLCYVGITRARKELTLSWSAARSGERAATRRPSRFLQDLAAAVSVEGMLPAARDGAPRARKPSAHRAAGSRIGACRICGRGLPTPAERALQRCRTCPADADPALLERLRQWRSDIVASTGAPAYTVFTDLTLQAVAELRPRTTEQLLTITGVGPVKADRYGSQVLQMVGEAGGG